MYKNKLNAQCYILNAQYILPLFYLKFSTVIDSRCYYRKLNINIEHYKLSGKLINTQRIHRFHTKWS